MKGVGGDNAGGGCAAGAQIEMGEVPALCRGGRSGQDGSGGRGSQHGAKPIRNRLASALQRRRILWAFDMSAEPGPLSWW